MTAALLSLAVGRDRRTVHLQQNAVRAVQKWVEQAILLAVC